MPMDMATYAELVFAKNFVAKMESDLERYMVEMSEILSAGEVVPTAKTLSEDIGMPKGKGYKRGGKGGKGK